MSGLGFGLVGDSLLGGDAPESTVDVQIDGYGHASGSLTVAFDLAGTVAAVADISGDLTVVAPTVITLDGMASGHGSASANLSAQRTFTGTSTGVSTSILILSRKSLAVQVISHARASGVLTVDTSSPGTTNPLVLGRWEPVFDLGGVMTISETPLLFT